MLQQLFTSDLEKDFSYLNENMISARSDLMKDFFGNHSPNNSAITHILIYADHELDQYLHLTYFKKARRLLNVTPASEDTNWLY